MKVTRRQLRKKISRILLKEGNKPTIPSIGAGAVYGVNVPVYVVNDADLLGEMLTALEQGQALGGTGFGQQFETCCLEVENTLATLNSFGNMVFADVIDPTEKIASIYSIKMSRILGSSTIPNTFRRQFLQALVTLFNNTTYRQQYKSPTQCVKPGLIAGSLDPKYFDLLNGAGLPIFVKRLNPDFSTPGFYFDKITTGNNPKVRINSDSGMTADYPMALEWPAGITANEVQSLIANNTIRLPGDDAGVSTLEGFKSTFMGSAAEEKYIILLTAGFETLGMGKGVMRVLKGEEKPPQLASQMRSRIQNLFGLIGRGQLLPTEGSSDPDESTYGGAPNIASALDTMIAYHGIGTPLTINADSLSEEQSDFLQRTARLASPNFPLGVLPGIHGTGSSRSVGVYVGRSGTLPAGSITTTNQPGRPAGSVTASGDIKVVTPPAEEPGPTVDDAGRNLRAAARRRALARTRQDATRTFYLQRLPYPARSGRSMAPKEAREEYGNALAAICDAYQEVLSDYILSLESIEFRHQLPYKDDSTMDRKQRKKLQKDIKLFQKLYSNFISQKTSLLSEIARQMKAGNLDFDAKSKLEAELTPLKARLQELISKIFPSQGTVIDGRKYSLDAIRDYFSLNESTETVNQNEPIHHISLYCFALCQLSDDILSYGTYYPSMALKIFQEQGELELPAIEKLTTQDSNIAQGSVALPESKVYKNILETLLKYSK